MKVKELFEKLKGYEDYDINISFDVPHEGGDCGNFGVLEVEFQHKKNKNEIIEKKIVLDSYSYPFFYKGDEHIRKSL